MNYPRVLVVALARINAVDTDNNGMLLRNLFSDWPRENIAQIYSSGDNGDNGFFGYYYQLGATERQGGSLFYKLKTNEVSQASKDVASKHNTTFNNGVTARIKCLVMRLLVDTGLYELIFRPKISPEMKSWVENFQPDIILAQGYNLTFAWLPLLLKKSTGAKLAFLTTDDWPTYLYSGQLGEPILFRWMVRPVVKSVTRRLFAEVDVPFAFGQPMAEEYASRYGKKFLILNHADSQFRFENVEPLRIHPPDVITIVAIGNYNRFRWPLILDVNDACQELHTQGLNVRLVVLTSSIELEGAKALSTASYVDVLPDPGNDLLPSYLKGADILLLAEGFDEGFVSAIKLSVSSKAHLFMFSHRPIIVYSHAETGIASYARISGWARLITNRDKKGLVEVIKQLLENKEKTRSLIAKADEIVSLFHSHKANRDILIKGLSLYGAGKEQNI